MLDKKFVVHKIELIREGLTKLKFFKDLTFEEIAKDWLKYHALKNIFMEMIGRALDINQHFIAELAPPEMEAPLDYTQTFLKLWELEILPKEFVKEIAKSAGFRNAIVHGYNQLDKHIVYKTVSEAISQYTKYCDYILKFLKKQK